MVGEFAVRHVWDISKNLHGRSVQDVVRFIPLERMALETDSPYLAECTLETVGNASEVVKLKDLPIEDVLRSTARNAERL